MISFLVNLLLAFLAGWLALWLFTEVKAPRPVAVIAAVLAGVVVFLSNFASQVV